jgi:hypothetical protein
VQAVEANSDVGGDWLWPAVLARLFRHVETELSSRLYLENEAQNFGTNGMRRLVLSDS